MTTGITGVSNVTKARRQYVAGKGKAVGVVKTPKNSYQSVTSSANRADTSKSQKVGGARAGNNPTGGGGGGGSPRTYPVGGLGGASVSVPYKAARMAKGGRMAGGGMPPAFAAAKKVTRAGGKKKTTSVAATRPGTSGY